MDTRQTSWPNSLILGDEFPSLYPRSCVQLGQRRRKFTTDQTSLNSHDFAQDKAIVEAINNGEESAFVRLTDRFHSAMVRVALTFVSSRPLAEAVVQDTWCQVLNRLDQFDGRSSLKAWIFGILTNHQKLRNVWEHRKESLPDKSEQSDGESEQMPQGQEMSSREVVPIIEMAMEKMPVFQRQVIMLRDVEGFTSKEVCRILGVSVTSQRDALHHARRTVQQALDKDPNLHMDSSQSFHFKKC